MISITNLRKATDMLIRRWCLFAMAGKVHEGCKYMQVRLHISTFHIRWAGEMSIVA